MAKDCNKNELITTGINEDVDEVIKEDTDDNEEGKLVFGRRPLQYSRAYKRFFEGWEEHEVMVAPGKFRTERVYVADYYTIRGGRPRKWKMAVCYFILMLGILTCFFQASTKDIAFNYAWYAAVVQALSLAAWLWMLIAIGSWLIASEKMTVGEMRSGPKTILRSTIAGIITNALAAVTCLLQLLIVWKEDGGQLLLCVVFYAANSAMALLIRCLEKSNEYLQEKNS